MCNKEHLVGYLYDELAAADRAAFEAHVRECADCRAEVGQLRQTRQHLELWSPPEPEFNFRIIREPAAAPRRRFAFVPQWALAAAAALFVVAGALAIANVEVRRTSDGFVVRTGWSKATPAQPVDALTVNAAATTPGLVPTAAAAQSSDRLRTAIAALEQRLAAIEQAQAGQAVKASAGARPGISAAELRQILAAVDSRQRAETALLIKQLWNDWNLARANDFAVVRRTVSEAEGRTNYQLMRNRDAIEQFRTVSQQK
jgi:hypothetical protein